LCELDGARDPRATLQLGACIDRRIGFVVVIAPSAGGREVIER
jgi:hypothetical protein